MVYGLISTWKYKLAVTGKIMKILGAFVLIAALPYAVSAQDSAEMNQRLGSCDAQSNKTKRTQCFEQLARDAVQVIGKQNLIAARDEKRPSKYSDLIAKAKANITAEFKDPSSAQWRNLYVSGSKFPVLCGEVNGKNSYGAYVGFKRFYASSEPMLQAIEGPKDSSILVAMWPKMCNDELEKVE